MVEAAIVLPLLFLIVALIIGLTVRTEENVGNIGCEFEEETAAWFDSDPMITEGIMRIRWVGKE